MTNDKPRSRRNGRANKNGPQESSQAPLRHPLAAPAVSLTHVVVTVSNPDILTVEVNGEPFPPTDPQRPWTRANFVDILEAITQDRQIPIRLEVHETDGSTFTDIVPTRKTNPSPLNPSPASPVSTAQDSTARTSGPEGVTGTSDLVSMSTAGFVAGEEIALAVVIAATAADPDGTAHVRIQPAVLRGAHEIVILGRISGTAVARRLS